MQDQVFIQDNFRNLICHVGTCAARYYEDSEYFSTEPYWTVAINGRLYTQIDTNNPTHWVFECRMAKDMGTVTVSFPRGSY